MNDLDTGVSRAAWACLLLSVDINLGAVSILPQFAGWLMLCSAVGLLAAEWRDFGLLRPLTLLLALWSGIDWLLSWGGQALEGRFLPLDLIAAAASLYFHFQFFTGCAALAERYQPEGAELDRRFLRWRTVQTLLFTAAFLLRWLPEAAWRTAGTLCMTVLLLLVKLSLIAALFALRRCFREAREP